MKFSKLLPHLVGAIAILNAPAMVSPLSNADITRMESAAQDYTRLRDYPNVMSPTELAAWRNEARTWAESWINFLESIDLDAMSRSNDELLAFYATRNKQVIDVLKDMLEISTHASPHRDSHVLMSTFFIREACAQFDASIVPLGMSTDRIIEQHLEGMRLYVAGMRHSLAVNDYYYFNHDSPNW